MSTALARTQAPRTPPSIDGRVPPHDLDAEASVLSAVIVEGSGRILDELVDFLKPEHFYAEAHRRIFEGLVALYAEGKPVDTTMIGNWLRERERIAQVGGMAYIVEILSASPAIVNVRPHGRIVFEAAKARAVILACQEATARGYVDYGDANEYAATTADRLHVIAHEDLPRTTEHVVELMKTTVRGIMAAAQSPNHITGAPTGFARYDRLTSGLHDGDLTIVAARPGMGKTSFVLNVAVNVATGSDVAEPGGVIFFSLEMPKEQIGQRLVCSEARVDVSKVRSGLMNPSDFSRITASATALAKLPLWVDDQPAISLAALKARTRRIQADLDRKPLRDAEGNVLLDANGEPKKRKLRLVAVDYLQLMSGREDARTREQEISEISRGLKALAKDLKLPVIALSQLNRAVETRSEKNKRPQLSDLRESGAIEQDADNIVFIYRDDYYNKESTERNIAELIVAKQRSGPTGTAKVRFDREFTRFDNLAESEHDDDWRDP